MRAEPRWSSTNESGEHCDLEEQVLQGVDSLQSEGLLDAVRQVGVVEYHIQAKGLGSQGYG